LYLKLGWSTNYFDFRGKKMLDIQCSEVSRGQITLTWKPYNTAVTDFVKDQIEGKYLYLLIQINNNDETWSEWVDIRKEKHTIWFRRSGNLELNIFPVCCSKKLSALKALSIYENEIFEWSYRKEIYAKLDRGFSQEASLLKLAYFHENNIKSLDEILCYKFLKYANRYEFKNPNWLDYLIQSILNIKPKDQCERRLLAIQTLVLVPIYLSGAAIIIPLVYFFKLITVVLGFLIGVRTSGFYWKDLLTWNETTCVNFNETYNFSLSPLALMFYALVVRIAYVNINDIQINLAVILSAICVLFGIIALILYLQKMMFNIKQIDQANNTSYIEDSTREIDKPLGIKLSLFTQNIKEKVCSPISND
jgi:hypothetical protein